MADTSLCNGCGSMLPLPDLSGTTTCPSCGREVQTDGGAAPAGPEITQGEVQARVGQPAPRPMVAPRADAARRTRRLGCATVAGLALVVAVAGAVIGARALTSDSARELLDPTYSRYEAFIVLGGSASVLEGPETAGTDVLAIVADTDTPGPERRLARLRVTGAAATVVWESDLIVNATSQAQTATSGDTLFVGLGDQVLALDAASGATRWQAQLRDAVTPKCPACFSVVDGRLVVRTVDAHLSAFGEASSEQQWSRRLASPAATVAVVGDRLLVVDQPETSGEPVAAVLTDAATGAAGQATAPTCAATDGPARPSALAPGDPILAIPGSDDVVAAFGFGTGCAARWDPTTGEVRWATEIPIEGSIDGERAVVGERTLVVGSSSGNLVAVDLAAGTPRELAALVDQSATPVAVDDGTVVAETVTSRGTRRAGLAGWDLETGALRWSIDFDDGRQPASPGAAGSSDALFEGSPRSVVVRGAEGVSIVVFDGASRLVSVAPLDLDTGRLGTEVRRTFPARSELSIPSLSLVGVDDGRLVVVIDSMLQSIPLAGNGEIITFPEVS